MQEFWVNCSCSNCNKPNWVYLGSSLDDGTDGEVEGYKCWNCKQNHWLDPENAQDFHSHEDDLDECLENLTVKGLKKPK